MQVNACSRFLPAACVALSVLFTLPGLAAEDADEAVALAMPSLDAQEVETFLDSTARALMLTHDVPGLTVALVGEGRIIATRGYGFASPDRAERVSPGDTLFRLASVSKLLVATAVMQMVEAGKLDLDANVNDYLTQFTIPDTYAQAVTLRHILTHTAGFEDYNIGSETPDESVVLPLAEVLEKHMPARVREPGRHVAYSNWAFSLAGLIVENQSGRQFERYVDEEIFAPLNMRHSTMFQPVPDSTPGRLSAGFVKSGGEWIDEGFYFSTDAPSGSLTSTANDMARFMLAHLGDGSYGGGRIVSPELAEGMREELFRPKDGARAMLYGFYEKNDNGHFAYGHGGAFNAFQTELVLVPDAQLGFFVSTNTRNGNALADEFVALFFDQFLPAETLSEEHAESAASSDPDVPAYLGNYRNLRQNYSRWEKAASVLGNDLSVSRSASGDLLIGGKRYVAQGRGVYKTLDGPEITAAFVSDDDQGQTHLSRGALSTYKKLDFLEQADTHRAIVVVGLIIMLLVLIRFAAKLPAWREYQASEKLARGLVACSAALYLVFFAVFLQKTVSLGDSLESEGVAGLSVLLTMALLGAAAALLAAAMVFRTWKDPAWTLAARVTHTLTVTVLVAFSWSLWYMNLIGPWNA
ncbi:MAG: serine hydrolase domain-containing protein [Pseudomonadota bacterium]